MTGPKLGTEWAILRAACSPDSNRDRLGALIAGPLNWPSLLDLAERHGVQPLLYQALSPLRDVVPPEQWSNLGAAFQSNLYKAMFLSRELIRVMDHLSACGLGVMLHKGLALAQMLYGDIALRQAGDIDLFIHAHDLPRIRHALSEIGYRPHLQFSDGQERAYLISGYECAFDGALGSNLLEVQWAIQPRFYAVDYPLEELFRRSVAVSVAGREMKTLCAEDQLLVLSVHAAKHVWARLIWLCDLARVIQWNAMDWDAVATRAKELGIVRILQTTILLAENLLGITAPESAKYVFRNEDHSQRLAAEIEDYITAEKTYDVESFAYFQLMLRFREKLADKAKFFTRLALTPGPNEWAVVRLPQPLSPLYRVIRLSRLAARAIGA